MASELLDPHGRLGATGREEGVYVRFDPGFGLNVIIGFRYHDWGQPSKVRDVDKLTVGIDGWERICELADAYRAREAALPRCEHGVKSYLFCDRCPKRGGEGSMREGNES